MHWWPLESQHVIAIMNQHHRHHLAQRFVRQRFQKASEQFPTKAFSIIHDVWWFCMTYDMKTHETSGFNVELNNIQNIMAHSCTLYICYTDTQCVLSISWLTVMWAHWKTPANGPEVLCVKDSVWTVKRRRTWRNCAHGRTSGQSRAELSATWQYFMIVKTHGG